MAYDEEVILRVDGVKIMEGVSCDWSIKPSTEEVETFQGVKTKTGPSKVTVKISRTVVDDTDISKLRNAVLNINSKKNPEPVVVEDPSETVRFPNPKNASLDSKLNPKSKTIDMEFTSDYPKFA